jgi:hypothetical protein
LELAVVELAAKFVLGPVLFVLILFFAQSIRLRWAAGMLLTFPALNGIGLFMASSKSIALASAMLPMIVVNGLLCLLYIIATQRGQPILGWKLGPLLLFWIGIALWVVGFSLNMEIPRRFQVAFAVVYAAVAVAATWLLWLRRKPRTFSQPSKSLVQFLKSWRGWGPRVLIFIVLLAAFGIVSYFGADSVAGRLGAAPILPLFALYSIASGDDSATKLEGTKVTVLIGPIVAMSFVIAFSAAVYQTTFATGFALLMTGWGACFFCIVGIAIGLDALEHRLKE